MAQSKRLEVLSNNLANVDTPGFKNDVTIFQARFAEAMEQGLDIEGSGSVNNIGGGVSIDSTVTLFAPGPVKRTSIPTDMAIEGQGFFEVQNSDNEKLLTRAGNFRLSSTGELLTAEGHKVLSSEGAPVTILPDQPWHVTPQGGVQQGGTTTNLSLVRPNSLGDLVKHGEKSFTSLAPTTPLALNDRQVASGHLEMSGVKPTLAMMELIETSRALEANINMIRNQDEMLGGLINRVLSSK